MGWAETGSDIAWGIILSDGHGEIHPSLRDGDVTRDTFYAMEEVFVPAQGFGKPRPSWGNAEERKAWELEAAPYNLIGLMSFGDGDSGLHHYMMYIKRTHSSWYMYDDHKAIDRTSLQKPTAKEIIAINLCADAIKFTGDKIVGLYVVASC